MQNYKMVAEAPKSSQLRQILDNLQPLSTTDIRTLPNFRALCSGTEGCKAQRSHTLFRSSRPDHIGQADLDVFRELGIKSIIDCRSRVEYLKSDGEHLLDKEYFLYRVRYPHNRNYEPHEPVVAAPFPLRRQMNTSFKELPKEYRSGETSDDGPKHKHFVINFFPFTYVWNVFCRAPFYIQFISLFVLLFDFIFQTGNKFFVRLFAKTTLNKVGLLGQYKDIIEFSKRGICAALKLMCDRRNLPAMLNCAHGKDRTGIVSAMVLSCLGKSHDYIASEYALSADGLSSVRERVHQEVVGRYHMNEEFITARYETMHQLLDYVCERYGSVADYLKHIGFGSEEQETLRQNLQVEVDPLITTKWSSKDGTVSLESNGQSHAVLDCPNSHDASQHED